MPETCIFPFVILEPTPVCDSTGPEGQDGERGTLLWPCVVGLAMFPLGVQWARLASGSFLSAALPLSWCSGQRRQAFLGAVFYTLWCIWAVGLFEVKQKSHKTQTTHCHVSWALKKANLLPSSSELSYHFFCM